MSPKHGKSERVKDPSFHTSANFAINFNSFFCAVILEVARVEELKVNIMVIQQTELFYSFQECWKIFLCFSAINFTRGREKHKYLERKKKFSPRKNLSFFQLRLDVSLMGKIIVQTSRSSIIHLYSPGERNIPQAFRSTRRAPQAADDNELLLIETYHASRAFQSFRSFQISIHSPTCPNSTRALYEMIKLLSSQVLSMQNTKRYLIQALLSSSGSARN